MASLQELPDDELDKLFRSSAGEFEPPYNPEDWNSLRRRLDDDDRKRLLDRFIYWGLPLLLLLLTTVSLLLPPNDVKSSAQRTTQRPTVPSAPDAPKTGVAEGVNSSPDRLASAKAEQSATASTSDQTDRSNDPVFSTENRVADNPAKTEPAAEAKTGRTGTETEVTTGSAKPGSSKPGSSKTGAGEVGPAESDKVVNRKLNEVRSGSSTRLIGSTTKNRRIKTGSSQNRLASSAEPSSSGAVSERVGGRRNRSGNLSGSDNAGNKNLTGSVANRKTRQPSVSDGSANGANSDETAVLPASPAVATPVLESEPLDLLGNLSYIVARTPARPILPRIPEPDLEPMAPPVVPNAMPPTIPVIGYPALSVRLVAAPDWNFVGKSTKAASDFQLGILGEYRFSRRFTLQSGVIRSVKKYTAAASDYAKPEHWYGPQYKSVGAVCTVLDIPVNLRFDALVNERRRWFISSGFSSYIMQKEYYKYNYPYGVKPYQQKYVEWEGKSGFHEFSHLNFSLGYEHNFSSDGPLRRFSWQVEPFLKYARRSTLGYGKIRLTSTGLFFSLRYRL